MMHSLAWVGWLVAALVALSATRNPFHLLLILLCVAVAYLSIGSAEQGSAEKGSAEKTRYNALSPLRFALVVIPLSALFNAATVHVGDTVLLRLPRGLPVLGGAITLEAFTFGILNGLVLTGIFTAFATLMWALPIHRLIHLIPRAFYPVAVVISIGVTFVPVTLGQFQQIREAQALRGHRVRGLRDWLPLFMPLLVGGLERALQLAEAMTARGFASAGEVRQDTATRASLVLGLVALLSGWLLRLVWGQEMLGLGLMLVGGVGILGTLWFVGRRVPRTIYRPEPWTRRDGVVVLGAAVALWAFVLPGLDRSSLVYYAYPALSLPDFDPVIGLTTLGLLGPALLLQRVSPQGSDGVNGS
jgi:energy-coupling factor transport system permease protein